MFQDEYGFKYKITLKSDFLYFDEGMGIWSESCALGEFLRGERQVVKIPFKPKEDELYFCIGPSGYIQREYSEMSIVDYMRYKTGNCFRTKEEAEANKDEFIEKLKGDWQ